MGRGHRRLATVLGFVLTVGMLPSSAHAGDEGHHDHESHDDTSCHIFPIAAAASVLATAALGAVIDDVTHGAPSGHEGWLTWNGDMSEPALAQSLTPPGNDNHYINPDDPSDHVLSVGDWVTGRPGAVSSWNVRGALDELIGRHIIVPVWDSTRGGGSKLAYHVSAFASIEILAYRLHSDNKITAKYLGPSPCVSPSKVPVAQPARATTAEDTATTIVLTGSSTGSATTLSFAVTPPANGVATVTGQPTCKAAGSGGDDGHGSHGGDGSGGDKHFVSTTSVKSFNHVAGHFGYSSDFDVHDGDHHDGHEGDHEGDHDHAKTLTCTVSASYTPAPDFFGIDTFTFTVSDGHTRSAPATVTVTVTQVNDPPVAGPDSASTAQGQTLTIPAPTLLTNDTPGPLNEASQSLTVTAVKGGADTHGTVTLANGTVTYIPAADFSGVASFTYTVCDNGTTNGQPDPKCADGVVTVTVTPSANQPPVADDQRVSGAEDTSLQVTLTGSDPDHDPITFAIATNPAHGTLTGAAPEVTYTPAPDYFGPDAFTFTTFDGQAASVPATVSITVTEVNDPPLAGFDSANTAAGQPTTIPAASLVTNDIPGPANEANQTLTVTAVTGGTNTHGTVALALDGTITYTPDDGFSGPASFDYTVCDNGTTNGQPDPLCTIGTVNVNVSAPNLPPLADDQSVTTPEDTSVPITLTGSDPDGDPLTYAIATDPVHGTLSGSAPSLTYTPAPDYYGPDSFTFTTFDGLATSVPATVSITVTEVNDPPTAGPDSISAPGRQPSGVTPASLLVNDRAGPSNEASQTLIITAADAGADTHGTVSFAHGAITYIPDLGYSGPATFTYTVCDNGTTDGQPDPKCADGVVSVTVTAAPNQPPDADVQSVNVAEDQSTAVTLTGSDADGDPITFAIATSPAHGTLTGTAPDLTYTPAPDYFGPDAFSFTTFDGQAASVPATVSITVTEVNDPPIAGPDSVSAPGGAPFLLDAASLLVNDVAGPANEANQTLNVTAVNGGADTHGTVSLANGTITFTPDDGFSGSASFTYTACDNGTTDGQPDPLCTNGGTVTVNVSAPNLPAHADDQTVTLAEDTSKPITLTGSDPENDPITYAIATAPTHGTLTGTSPLLTYQPAQDYNGPDSFTFTTHDAFSSSAPATVSINVTEVNDPPQLGSDAATLGGAGVLAPPPPAPHCGTPCGVIYGDPHLMTFDGTLYDAQAVGEVIAAKSTTDDFEVQARFAPPPNQREVSIDVAVAMRVAGHRVTLYRTLTGYDARIDGTLVTIPANPRPLPGGGTIGTYGLDNEVIVVWPDGSVAIVNAVGVYPTYYRFTVDLGLAPARLGHVVGLLGNADGDKTNDLATRAGQPVTFPNTPFAELYGTYINSWRISPAESLFDYDAGQTTATFTDLTFPDAPVTPQTLPAAARTSATNICALFGLTTTDLTNACIVDVGVTGDADFANNSADAQAAALGIASNTGGTDIGTSTTVTTTTPGENAVRTFPGTAGAKVTLTVTGSTYATVDMTVRDPKGNFVTSLSASAANAFRDVFTLPATGTYSITVDPRDTQIGTLTFVFGLVQDNTGTTAIGTPTTVSSSTIGENPVRTFAGTAGQKLTLTVTGNTYSIVDLAVRDPNGNFVNSLSTSLATGFRDVFTLPATGTYSITVDPRADATGSLTFVLGLVPDNTGTTAIGTPTTVSSSTIGENPVRTFPGTAGQKLTLTVSANTYSIVDLAVRDAIGNFVNSLSTSLATGFRDVFTLPTTGNYTITIDPRADATGSLTFVLGLVPDNTGTTVIGTTTNISTSTVGENAVRTFPATAGQQVTLTVSNNTYSIVDLTVRDPIGNFVTSLSASLADAFHSAFTLATTGNYTITIDPRAQFTGSLTFLLANAIAGPSLRRTAQAGTDVSAFWRAVGNTVGHVTDQIIAAARIGAAAPTEPSLSISVADLLANDRPGPANESAQTLTVTGITTSAATHGTATLANGILTYTPDAGFGGNAFITYTACDNGTTNGQPDPLCNTGTLTIKVTANHPPTVDPQTATTAEDTSVALVLTGADSDGDPVAFGIATAPSHGVLSGSAPALTYKPAPDFHGIDTFTFTGSDGHDLSVPATVTITVTEVNDPPVPQTDTITSGAGKPVSVPVATLLGNDAAGPFDENSQTLTITAVTPGADTHGTVALANGIVTYTPDAGFTGTGVVGYTVCDNGTTNGQPDPLCANSTLSIVLNRPPTANDQNAQTSRTAPADLTLTANDPEGDALTFAITTPPQHGTLSGTAPNVTYTANAGFIGTDTFAFTAADAYNTSAPATVSIVVNDVPPSTLKPDSATVLVGNSALIDVLANDTPGTGSMDPTTLAIASLPNRGNAVVESGKIRYAPSGTTNGSDTFSYTACDSAGGCGTAVVSIDITVNHPPKATDDSYDVAAGTSLRPAAPGVLGNDSDPDGDKMQARLVTGVTNGTLLLNSTGAFTYTPHGPGIDTFVYHVVDPSGAVSNDATVTIVVTGPPGPPNVGNDLYKVQQGTELNTAAPGVLDNDFSPNPRLHLTTLLAHDAAHGSLLFHPDGSFVYTPTAGYTGIDQFSYFVRDSEGRVSQEAHVGVTVTSGGPATATMGTTSPAAGAKLVGPTHFTATLVAPAGETVTNWTTSYRRPGDPTLVQLATGSGPSVAADFDPTTVRNGIYDIEIRAVTSGGGILVNDTAVGVEGDYKPGRYRTTFQDLTVDASGIPINLQRTYDSIDKTVGDFGVGWNLDFADFRIDSNGPVGGGPWSTFTCGSFPFLAACYASQQPHFVTITWPDGHLERFQFTPVKGSHLLPSITTAGFTAEPGTTSTLQAVDGRLLLSGGDFLLGDFFSAEGIFDPTQFILTDRNGTQYTLDKTFGLLGVKDRNGNTLTIDAGGIHSSEGPSVQFNRDDQNRISEIVGATGTIEYTYSPAGDLIGVAYPNGVSQAFTYDSHHGLLTTSGGGQVVRTLHYDANGRLVGVTDGNGNTSTISIDVAGHQQVFTDATGQLTTVNTYDDRGDLVQQDRTAGGKTITTKATYDAIGRRLSTTDGLGHTTSTTYNPAGNVLTKTDANGHTTTYTYNAFGEPLTVTEPLGHVTTNVYDTNGNRTETDAADGGKTKYTHDSAGHVLTTTDGAGRVTTNTYDSAGHLATTTEPGGNVTHQSFNANTGLLTSGTDATGATTHYAYDSHGNLTSLTDANGHTRTAAYDAFDRITSLTDSTGATTHYTYDAAGNRTSTADRNGQTTTETYDADSRLASKTVPGAGTTTYTYDAFGRETAVANTTAQLTLTYDDADRALSVTSAPTTANALPTTTFTYSYDAAGNVTSTQGPGGTTGYTYDGNAKLNTLTDPAGGAFTFGYDGVGRQTSMTRPNGISDTNTYDLAGDLTTQHSSLGATLVNQADYAYNAAGLRSSLTTTAGTTNYNYDATSQLTTATPPSGSGLANEQYTYDLAGNRTSTASSPLGSFTYDNADRLLTDATTTYQYDGEGNLISRTIKATGAKTTYMWTAEHQLIGVTYPDNSTSTFRYDPLGRRVEVDDGSATTRYAYDEQAIAAEYNGANALVATYVHDPTAPTRPFEMTRGGQRYFYLTDGVGSTTALTTSTGTTANTYTYAAFGAETQTGTVANPFTYTGQVFDETAGLFLFARRVYDPSLGRFLSEDPDPAVNPYPYVENSPTNAVDPTGASTEDTVISRTVITRVEEYVERSFFQCIKHITGLILTQLGGVRGMNIVHLADLAAEECATAGLTPI